MDGRKSQPTLEHVANASKSGGFLDHGGKSIDEHEAKFLQDLQETLG